MWLKDGGSLPALQIDVPGVHDDDAFWRERHYTFEQGALHKDFQWLRTPKPERIFAIEDGHLRLHGRESIGSWFEQALVARRQTHFSCDAETVVDFAPTDERTTAGLVAYYQRYNFHYLAVTAHSDGQRELLILSSAGSFPDGNQSFPASPVLLPAEGPVRLALTARGAALQFYFAVGEDALTPVGPVLDASLLSDEGGAYGVDGSFTGAFVGMAASDLNGTVTPADFSHFTYRPVCD